MNLSMPARTVLMFLYKQHDERGNVYGNIAHQTGIPRTVVEELCQMLFEQGLAELRSDRIFITQSGRDWIDLYIEERDDRIREYVYKDFEFALLRFVIEQYPPLAVDDFPEVLHEEAPVVTKGSNTMNLIQHLEIIWSKYFQSPNNKYIISPAGRKRYEFLAKEKGLSVGGTKQSNNSRQSDFSEADKEELNAKLDQLKEMIMTEFETVKMGQQFTYDDFAKELDELRQYYHLPRKTWRQLLTGKLTEMAISGVVSETISKRIAEHINPIVERLLE